MTHRRRIGTAFFALLLLFFANATRSVADSWIRPTRSESRIARMVSSGLLPLSPPSRSARAFGTRSKRRP